MKEAEYVKGLKKHFHYNSKEIEKDLKECMEIASKKGISIEKVYEVRSAIIESAFESLETETTYLTDPFIRGPRNEE